jgi:hypothetical protein
MATIKEHNDAIRARQSRTTVPTETAAFPLHTEAARRATDLLAVTSAAARALLDWQSTCERWNVGADTEAAMKLLVFSNPKILTAAERFSAIAHEVDDQRRNDHARKVSHGPKT